MLPARVTGQAYTASDETLDGLSVATPGVLTSSRASVNPRNVLSVGRSSIEGEDLSGRTGGRLRGVGERVKKRRPIPAPG
jgi:hypothetical protein